MRRLWAVLIAVVVVVLPVAGTAGPYVSGATVVYKDAGQQPAVDSGAVVCSIETGAGVGGGCLPFSAASRFVGVSDAAFGPQVAFQVCIDNNGDNRCVSGGDKPPGPCDDLVWFSHSDDGSISNPLGPLPGSRSNSQQCNPKHSGWDGYVVFLCEGVHTVNGAAHVHPATTGMIQGSPTGPSPFKFGDFCGGIRDQVIKEYEII